MIEKCNKTEDSRIAIDSTYSAPKSVSILSEIYGDERVRAAHDRAVQVALNYTESNYAATRIMKTGEEQKTVQTDNLTVAAFQHNLSRELDPQLHTHCVVFNITKDAEGRERHLEAKKIFDNKNYLGQIYRNELAIDLRQMGYAIRSDDKGLFEVEGVDQRLLYLYSQRSEQIKERYEELKKQFPNLNNSKLKEMAALDSREPKKNVNIESVKDTWNEKLKQAGFTKESIKESTRLEFKKKSKLDRSGPAYTSYDYVRMALNSKTETESIFKKEEILRTAGKYSVGEKTLSELENAFGEIEKSKGQDREIIKLADEKYTTKEIMNIEKEILSRAEEGKDKMNPVFNQQRAQDLIKNYETQHKKELPKGLTKGQKEAAAHILSNRDNLLLVSGAAGTGKTTMLAAVRELAEREGFTVRGLSYTGKAAQEIEDASRIKSQTIDSFLPQFSKNTNQNLTQPNQIWIVDEASMLGAKKMHKLQTRALEANAKIVLIGDTKQLPSIEAGKIFKDLQDKSSLKTVHMEEVLRQQDKDY